MISRFVTNNSQNINHSHTEAKASGALDKEVVSTSGSIILITKVMSVIEHSNHSNDGIVLSFNSFDETINNFS